ncbi:MAG: superoxide dismutase [Candidatus Niyogibacteria bacterium]|nr:superoxide dismutase [Candidatus Niyogibacteria bacterium]
MFTVKNYEYLLGMRTLSDTLLKNHFKLYEGYVANINKLIEQLGVATVGTPQYAEMRRRFGWEWNGMRLHEFYFGNLAKDGKSSTWLSDSQVINKKIAKDFGSYDAWEKDFRAAGAMRGIGWVALAYDAETDKLMNVWINEHDVGHLAGSRVILVMDMFEHAFITDFGLNRGEYIDVFFRHIDWKEAENRFVK